MLSFSRKSKPHNIDKLEFIEDELRDSNRYLRRIADKVAPVPTLREYDDESTPKVIVVQVPQAAPESDYITILVSCAIVVASVYIVYKFFPRVFPF